MKLIAVNNKEVLDNFVAAYGGDFLQSWDWGEFQQAVGWEVARWGVAEEGKLLAVATLIKKPLAAGFSYWFCPRGPIINFQFSIPARNASHSEAGGSNFQMPTSSSIHDRVGTIFNFLISNLAETAKQEKIVFFRFEPVSNFQLSTRLPDGQAFNFQLIRTLDIEPSQTSILDLSKSAEELLTALSQKTRYNIRLAEKKGVKIELGTPNDFAAWWRLLAATSRRDGFRLHSKNYYQKILSLDFTKLYLAKKDSQVLAGIAVIWFGQTATYIHGASADESRNLMAPHLLQWTAIKDAQAAGLKSYDFYGIDEVKWPGVSRFKLSFGGQTKAYPGTFDLVFQSLYYRIYQLLRKVRRLI